ncbi:Peptidase family M23 [Frankia canadensis]|uniref:Peptidase family M23 n=1 Tax=Frankia canadensis TaxID=1836972 RepID=A0A2I2L213_9ACTN|nr:M23 family metallopeptidase [Frankia canadensis]SNQ51976.1 Peptidase family M23 [Frankia canadensis]SOU59266.1 Peptidase family M23 [Frankia canadensis]
MPRLPRFDPLWLVIPAIAILLALGWPTHVPIGPRADGAPLTLTGHELTAARSPATVGPGAELVPGVPVVLPPTEPSQRAPRIPPAPADRATGFSPPHDPPGPPATRLGDPRRPALTPPAAEGAGGGAGTPPPAPPPASASPTRPPAALLPGSLPVLRWPLRGAVSVARAFDRPATPYGPGHRGVDLAARPRDPVLAAADGTVSYAGPVAGRGVVAVDHGGVRTTYEPLRPAVASGDAVHAGDVIGWLTTGHPGCASAACLHWGLVRGAEEYLDPLGSFRRVPPRLLPVGQPARGARPAQSGEPGAPRPGSVPGTMAP